MFTMSTDQVIGGWNAIDNLISDIGRGISTLASDFFPTPQRTSIKSETVQTSGASGQTYRETSSEAQSILQTSQWAQSGFIGSPYQSQFSIPTKIAESQQAAQTIGPKSDPIGESLDWALGVTKKVTTLYDQIRGLWEPREIIEEKPRVGYPEGQTQVHLNEKVEMAADVAIGAFKTAYEQIKGLFGLGYPSTETQKVSPVTTAVSGGLSFGTIAVIVLLLWLASKK